MGVRGPADGETRIRHDGADHLVREDDATRPEHNGDADAATRAGRAAPAERVRARGGKASVRVHGVEGAGDLGDGHGMPPSRPS